MDEQHLKAGSPRAKLSGGASQKQPGTYKTVRSTGEGWMIREMTYQMIGIEKYEGGDVMYSCVSTGERQRRELNGVQPAECRRMSG